MPPILPVEVELFCNTYTLILAFPNEGVVKVPPETVLVSPVIASTYVPFGIPVNVATPEMPTHKKLYTSL